MLPRKRTTFLVIGAIVTALLILTTLSHMGRITHILAYATRPLWDTAETVTFTVLPFYPPTATTPPTTLCAAHGWTPLSAPKRVLDVVIFSVELDLLELRFRELDPVTDVFVVVESRRTFTGLEKNLTFAENRGRFAFVEDKIRYLAIEGRTLKKGDDPFDIEAEMRGEVTQFLRSSTVGLKPGDAVIMADVDEIPSREAVQLIRNCGNVPEVLHLRMRNFLYSYDFLQDSEHWRAKVVTVPSPPDSLLYTHGKQSNSILSDAGWHCSFCFPHLSDFVFKMKAYSHADRASKAYLLDPKRIQKVICDGTDIFDMLPEAYTYKDLVYKWGALKKLESAVNVPKYLIESTAKGDTRFKYLLPGGCIREQY
ncbi:hypothetical protein HDU98_010787 [Podochytrium sp. JEL0797]|nr:hypothetical protein HDU98_010787 [Podochytrium sp. JEL0797]